jgi:transposase
MISGRGWNGWYLGGKGIPTRPISENRAVAGNPQDRRKVFEGILYVLRTGCQWKAAPKSDYGSASSIHQYFLEWQAAGVFEQLWRASLLEYDGLEGIAWEWQSLDGAMVKAPMALGSVGRNPTGREKKRQQKEPVG